jgi:hypothetical protein
MVYNFSGPCFNHFSLANKILVIIYAREESGTKIYTHYIGTLIIYHTYEGLVPFIIL